MCPDFKCWTKGTEHVCDLNAKQIYLVRNYKMKALQKDEQTRDQKKWTTYMGFKITQKAEVHPTMNISTHKSERQV